MSFEIFVIIKIFWFIIDERQMYDYILELKLIVCIKYSSINQVRTQQKTDILNTS